MKSKRFLLVMVLLFFIFSNSIIYAQENIKDELKQYCETVPIEDSIGQLFIVGLPKVDYTTYKDKEIVDTLINDLKIGGVMLNTYNFYINEDIYNDKGDEFYLSEIIDMINYLQYKAIKTDISIPLFTCIDFESHYASISKGVSLPPSALTMGHVNNAEYLEDLGEMVGNELSAIGINMILGPVLDTPENVNGEYDITLSNRYFTNRPDMTHIISSHYIKGLREGNLMVITKHFPGYCDLSENPHSDIPIFSGNLDTINKNIEIYENLNALYDGVMSANYYIENLDLDKPIMLNSNFKKILGRSHNCERNKDQKISLNLNDKLVITDDLSNMEIVENYMITNGYDYSDIAIQAFNAGHDMILFSHFGNDGKIGNFKVEDFRKVLKDMTIYIKSNKSAEKQFRESLYRILSLKNKYDGKMGQSFPQFKNPWNVGKYKNINTNSTLQ